MTAATISRRPHVDDDAAGVTVTPTVTPAALSPWHDLGAALWRAVGPFEATVTVHANGVRWTLARPQGDRPGIVCADWFELSFGRDAAVGAAKVAADRAIEAAKVAADRAIEAAAGIR